MVLLKRFYGYFYGEKEALNRERQHPLIRGAMCAKGISRSFISLALLAVPLGLPLLTPNSCSHPLLSQTQPGDNNSGYYITAGAPSSPRLRQSEIPARCSQLTLRSEDGVDPTESMVSVSIGVWGRTAHYDKSSGKERRDTTSTPWESASQLVTTRCGTSVGAFVLHVPATGHNLGTCQR